MDADEPRVKSAVQHGDDDRAEKILESDSAVRKLSVEPVITSRTVGTPVQDEARSTPAQNPIKVAALGIPPFASRIQIPAPVQTVVREEIDTFARVSTPAQNHIKVAALGIPPQLSLEPMFRPWENSIGKPEPVSQKIGKPEPISQKVPSVVNTVQDEAHHTRADLKYHFQHQEKFAATMMIMQERNEVSSRLKLGGAIDEIFSILYPWHSAHLGDAGRKPGCIQCDQMVHHLRDVVKTTDERILVPLHVSI